MAFLILTMISLLTEDVSAVPKSGNALKNQIERTGLRVLEKHESRQIRTEQEREWKGIQHSHDELQPIRQSPHDPIDDSKRVLALMIMAHHRNSNKTRMERIPDVLYRVIFEYSDHNEIRTLFRMFSSSEDSKCALGLESYEVMHKQYASRDAKVRYFRRLMNRPNNQYMHMSSNAYGRVLGLRSSSIQYIWWFRTWNENISFPEIQHPLNWQAVGELTNLRILEFRGVNIPVSMSDLQALPDSLTDLDISDNIWTTTAGDVDLSLLRRPLERFWAAGCQGMNGSLNLDAPYSNLRYLDVADTQLYLQVDPVPRLPPSLRQVRPVLILELLDQEGIQLPHSPS